MSIKSMEELVAQATTTLADNVTGLISALDVRQMITDFIESIAPGYGVMRLAGPAAKACTAVPSKITPWTNVEEVTAGMYVASAANGEITREIATAGLAGATDFITVGGSVNGPNNSNFTLEVFKNGVGTGIKTSVTCTGTTDNVGVNIAGLSYTASVDAVYDVRASSVPNGNHNLTGLYMIVQSQPVRAY